MTNKPIRKDNRKLRLAMTGMVSGAVLALSAPAHALRYDIGPVSGTLDSTISVGARVRTEERDNQNVAKANQPGTKPVTVQQGSTQAQLLGLFANPPGFAGFPVYNNPDFSTSDFDVADKDTPGLFTANSDDGNLNYDQFDPIGGTVKVNQEVGINYTPPISGFNKLSAFVRGFYFFDAVNTEFTEDALRGFPDDERPQSVEDEIGFNASLLDAYISGQFNLGGAFLNVRFGRQVISWGESTFIQNSINVINPFNLSNLRTAGAQIEEALIPQEMLYANLDVTRNLSLEGFWQLNFEETEIDSRGTFFGTVDSLATDGRGVILGSGMNSNAFSSAGALQQAGLTEREAEGMVNVSTQNRLPAVAPDDDLGQFGFAARYIVPQWWSTEFGAYFINHHSRLPIASWQLGSSAPTQITPGFLASGNRQQFLQILNTPGTTNPESGAQANAVGGAFFEYPEDIQTYGLSFNTLLPNGTALQGELSFKEDAPKQVATLEPLAAAVAPALGLSPASISQVKPDDNGYIKGFRRLDTYQFQSTATHAFGPGWGASQRILLGEVGAQWIAGMPDEEDLLFAGANTSSQGGGVINADGTRRGFAPNAQQGGPGVLGAIAQPRSDFADDFGWGYRLIGLMSYNNVFGSWNVTPSLAWSHDVQGTTPGPSQSFTEGVQSITSAVEFDYLSRMKVSVEYTRFQGGGDQNAIRDRDFASINFSYSF